MKLLQLELNNINSLKGKHKIDFTKEPLNNADIFAIIGATGSGKSTILDAITLALFNRTPRFKSISKGSISTDGTIVTRHQKSAFAKITYEINKVQYQSVWEIESTRNNTYRDYHMTLWQDGQPLDLKKGDVPKKNEKIIGLSYEQFTKAIILSQGEFSKFLKADQGERSELLEKITGTSIYRELGAKTFEVQKEKRLIVEQKTELLNSIELLSKEELETIQEQQALLTKTVQENSTKLEKINKLVAQLDNLANVTKKLQELEQQQTINKSAIEAFQPQVKLLKLHQNVLPYRQTLNSFSKTTKKIGEDEQSLVQTKQLYVQEIKRKKQAIQELAIITKEAITESNFLESNKLFEKKVLQITYELDTVKNNGNRLNDEINILIQSNAIQSYQFNSKEVDRQIVEKELTSIASTLQHNQYSFDTKLQEIEQKQNEIDTEWQDYQELSRYQERTKSLQQEQTSANQATEQLTKQLETFPAQLEVKTSKVKTVELAIENLELKQTIASFEEHRQELQEGKECPLCGSTHHPFTVNLPEGKETLSSKLIATKQELVTSKQQLDTLKQQEHTLRIQLNHQKELIEKSSQELSQLKQSTLQKLHKPERLTQLSTLHLEEKINTLEQQKKQLKKLVYLLQKVEPLQRLQQKLKERNDLRETYISVQQKKKDLYPNDDISDKMNHLQNQFTESNLYAHNYHNQIQEKEEQLANVKNEFSALQQEIQSIQQITNIPTIQALQNAILKEDVANQIIEQQQQLNDKRNAIVAKIETLSKQKKEQTTKELTNLNGEKLKEQQADLNQAIQQQNQQLGVFQQQYKANQKAKERYNQLHNELKLATKEHRKWKALDSLIGDKTGKKFSTFAQGLTLKQLIAFTNKRLENLSGRYVIYQPATGKELMIIDKLQGNSERSIKTLSGGETFLVSLALALSLSDLASKDVSLQSLFIDEGFGTLDDETLESSLDLLEKLQTESDKTIGVISHVKQLKERIAVQIQLKKNSQGHSNISIVGL